MDDDGTLKRVASLLEEIRDNQNIQLERQAEALTLQKQQFELVREQYTKTLRIQDRAEALQNKSAQIVAASRKILMVVIPVIAVLLVYVSWLLFRR